MSEMLTLRVAREIKAEMENYDINWSKYIRESIRQKLIELRREAAFQEMDEITGKMPISEVSMADEVIKWRKKR